MQREVIEFGGYRFTRYPESVERSSRVYFSGWIAIDGKRIKMRLHQYIWTLNFGKIPAGHHIHHKDGNPLNNDISNLECLRGAEHLSEHSKHEWRVNRDAKLVSFNEKTRAAAIEWHKSEAGREWHAKHAKTSIFGQTKTHSCKNCGLDFQTNVVIHTDFCSKKCNTAHNQRIYRADKRYHIRATCAACGVAFKKSKWSSTVCCSRKCASDNRRSLRLARSG